MLKQSLKVFKLIQQRFNKFQRGFKGVANGFDIALQQNRMDVEAVCSGLKWGYLPHRLGFLCSHRGSNLIFHAHCLLSKKLVTPLIVTGEGGAETIADNNSKTIQYIFFPGGLL